MKKKESPQYSADEAKLLAKMLDCRGKVLRAKWRPIFSFIFLVLLFLYFVIQRDLDSVLLIVLMIIVVLYTYITDIFRLYSIDKNSKIFRQLMSNQIAYDVMKKHEQQYPGYFNSLFTICNKHLGTNFHSSFYKKDS